jgi:pimeloyl-ACP methyl ester carboxylesterase
MPNKSIAAVAAAVVLLSAAVVPARAEPVKNVVIVHGAFADDVAATKTLLDLQEGPTLLVGHSYGGVVITEAGNAPNVAGLVYIAAFIPDKGESALSLLAQLLAATMTRQPRGLRFQAK